jgi:hypothetical protein
MEVAAVGPHLVEGVTAVILETEDDPLAVGRVGAGEGVDGAALVLRQVWKVGPAGRMVAMFAESP